MQKHANRSDIGSNSSGPALFLQILDIFTLILDIFTLMLFVIFPLILGIFTLISGVFFLRFTCSFFRGKNSTSANIYVFCKSAQVKLRHVVATVQGPRQVEAGQRGGEGGCEGGVEVWDHLARLLH